MQNTSESAAEVSLIIEVLTKLMVALFIIFDRSSGSGGGWVGGYVGARAHHLTHLPNLDVTLSLFSMLI